MWRQRQKFTTKGTSRFSLSVSLSDFLSFSFLAYSCSICKAITTVTVNSDRFLLRNSKGRIRTSSWTPTAISPVFREFLLLSILFYALLLHIDPILFITFIRYLERYMKASLQSILTKVLRNIYVYVCVSDWNFMRLYNVSNSFSLIHIPLL